MFMDTLLFKIIVTVLFSYNLPLCLIFFPLIFFPSFLWDADENLMKPVAAPGDSAIEYLTVLYHHVSAFKDIGAFNLKLAKPQAKHSGQCGLLFPSTLRISALPRIVLNCILKCKKLSKIFFFKE